MVLSSDFEWELEFFPQSVKKSDPPGSGLGFSGRLFQRSLLWDSLIQVRMLPGQGLEVEGFVVRDASFPTAKQDTDPFVGEHANGRMMGLSGFALEFIKGFGPGGFSKGLSGKLVKGLA